MATPGSNLLRQALRVIRPTTVDYHRYAGRVENEYGSWVTSYHPPVQIKASVQAVDRSRYESLGLDFSRSYVMIFSSHDLNGVHRDSSPDRFVLLDGRAYTAVSETDWYGIDGTWVTGSPGWSYVLAVLDSPLHPITAPEVEQ